MYAIGSNVPGYAPEADATLVETWAEATHALEAEIERHLDMLADSYGTESKVFDSAYRLAAIARKRLDYDVIRPTSDSVHDLGRIYWIQ